MPYFGRTVGRAKGVGKIVYWKQGGGPKKAGLGPQINVTTWGRRVIARRTNSCCCDPIELTGISLSIPWDSSNPTSADTAWNLSQGSGDNLGLVGPPQNDISGGQINTKRQIYAVATFNKVISYDDLRALPTPSFTPLPDNTDICICGLREITDMPPGAGGGPNTTDPRILNGTVICKTALSANATYVGYKYYELARQYTSVTQIPGGTITDTTNSTTTSPAGPQGHLRTGSRFLVSSTQTASNNDYGSLIAETNNPKGGVLTNFWSQSGVPDGTGVGSLTNPLAQTAFTAGTTPNTRFANAFAIGGSADTADPRVYGTYSTPLMNEKRGGFVSNKIDGLMPTVPQGGAGTLNRYLGNCMGVYMTNQQNKDCPSALSGGGLNTPATVQNANICLVQGLGVAGPIQQPNFTVRPGFKEYYSADAVYVSNGPVDWLQGDYALFINITSLIQVALVKPMPNGKNNTVSGSNGLVVGPPVGVNYQSPCWRDGVTPSAGFTSPQGMFPPLGTGTLDSNTSGPWQVYGIKDGDDNSYIKPAYADCLLNALGVQNRYDVTFDSSANGLAVIDNKVIGIMTLGDVVEKLRQSTSNLYSSYVIRDLLKSKYPCGNDGYDAPVGDINIKSGNPVLAVADINEGNVLQLLA